MNKDGEMFRESGEWQQRSRQSPWGEGGMALEEVQQKIRREMQKWGGKKVIWIILGILAAVWLLSGLYTVGPGEVGVEVRLGKVSAQTVPGINYHLPWPIERVDIVNVSLIRRAEIGFRTVEREGVVRKQRVLRESLMLTGDENIADIQVLVQYRVDDPVKFLFRVKDPEAAVHATTQIAIRSTVGRTTIDDVMTVGRPVVEVDTKEFAQRLLDAYGTGIHIVELKLLVVDPPDEVMDAFHEVVRAFEDRERFRKEAEGYAESVVPMARGDAERIVRAAEAHLAERVTKAEGSTERFLSVLREYEKARHVTRQRLYLETMERILAVTEKVIIDPEVGGNVLPLLQLGGGREIEGDGETERSLAEKLEGEGILRR